MLNEFVPSVITGGLNITFENIFIAINVKERHDTLYLSIGFCKEEHDSMEMVTWLIVGSTAYVLLGTLFQSIFYNLYNSSYHPFAKILDLSEGSEGKLF